MAESEAKTEPKTEETTETKEEEYKEGKASMVIFELSFWLSLFWICTFQGDFIGGLKQEFFGSYEAPPYTVVNTFEVNGKKVSLLKDISLYKAIFKRKIVQFVKLFTVQYWTVDLWSMLSKCVKIYFTSLNFKIQCVITLPNYAIFNF